MDSHSSYYQFLLQTSQPHPHRGVRKTAQLPKEVEAIEDDKQGSTDDVSYVTLGCRAVGRKITQTNLVHQGLPTSHITEARIKLSYKF